MQIGVQGFFPAYLCVNIKTLNIHLCKIVERFHLEPEIAFTCLSLERQRGTSFELLWSGGLF